MNVGRLLLRVIVVPIACGLAVMAAALVAFAATWNSLALLDRSDPTMHDGVTGVIGLLVLFLIGVETFWMLLPAAVSALIAEVFAIRSWIYHALNGALSIWIGWAVRVETGRSVESYGSPLVILAAGLAAGFVYWAIAGRNAGVTTAAAPTARQPNA